MRVTERGDVMAVTLPATPVRYCPTVFTVAAAGGQQLMIIAQVDLITFVPRATLQPIAVAAQL